MIDRTNRASRGSWAGRLRLLGLTLGTAFAVPEPASAAWVRTYAVEWDEPALYYAGPGGPTEPGADCPRGTNPEPNWAQVLVKAGYPEDQARWLLDPGNTELKTMQRLNQLAFRGRDRANVYVDPGSTPDPGFIEVSGKVAEGVNLDDDLRTGLVSPTGERGVDNAFYRAVGCWKSVRGRPGRLRPRNSPTPTSTKADGPSWSSWRGRATIPATTPRCGWASTWAPTSW
ncbi:MULTISPECIES: hypothetical protein [unclassified Phenylobacterium]|uniref:hypothetical protein n=1 Tax=unclassified Phenylobacterium TaxID=2640670 RepID=UPI000AD5BB6C|nr:MULTISPECIES: hypothetical protein [unclassified Phenylobacterium]